MVFIYGIYFSIRHELLLCFIYEIIYFYIKENMMCQNSNGMFNNRIKFKFNQEIYIKTMRCKIMRFQKLMWRNIMRSTKSQKASVLHYSIDYLNFDEAMYVT